MHCSRIHADSYTQLSWETNTRFTVHAFTITNRKQVEKRFPWKHFVEIQHQLHRNGIYYTDRKNDSCESVLNVKESAQRIGSWESTPNRLTVQGKGRTQHRTEWRTLLRLNNRNINADILERPAGFFFRTFGGTVCGYIPWKTPTYPCSFLFALSSVNASNISRLS